VKHVACMAEMRNTKICSENVKLPLWRPRCRWKDNIKMDLNGTEYEGVDWIHLAQDRYQ